MPIVPDVSDADLLKEKAATKLHFSLTRNADQLQGMVLEGVLLARKGEVDAAVSLLQQAIDLSPGNSEYHRQLGEILQSGGRYSQAVLSLEQSLRLNPLHPGTWATMSETLLQMGEVTPALDCLSQAIQLDANYVPARILLGNTQRQFGELEAAEQNYRFVLELEPENAIAQINLASTLRDRGEVEEALEILRAVFEQGVRGPALLFNLATTLADIGEFVEAREHFSAAIPHHAQPAKVLYNLAQITRFTEANRPQLVEWEAIARKRLTTDEDHIHLHFGLGKAHDDLGQYQLAFHHYEQGNVRVPVTFDAESHRRMISETMRAWTPEFVRSRTEWGISSTAPILIVGMPRSGTTLVEQIFASHSLVRALGERTQLGQLVTSHSESLGCFEDPFQAAHLTTQADLYEIAQGYLPDGSLLADKAFFTDKMPTNFLLLGWAGICFPEAKLIHCRRDPRDILLSCFFQHFTARLPFAYNFQNLIAYYREYERLMEHWKALFPGRILDVNYEQLVSSPEMQSRRLIEHCHLEWEESCLQTHVVDRAIHTASGWQVRQPIYTSSQKRWMKYREWIQPLLDEFGTTE